MLCHVSVRHPGQEIPSTSMIDVPCDSQRNNAPGTSLSKYSQNYDGWKVEEKSVSMTTCRNNVFICFIAKSTPILVGPKFVSKEEMMINCAYIVFLTV